MPRFRVSDNSLNSQGFRVLSDGGDVSSFMKNPIMLWMHIRFMKPGDPLPIGRWENLKLEDGSWMADPMLDEKDEFAAKLKSKVDSGIINMASIGINNIEWSDDPALLLPGQTRPTITKWELREISLVDIGANKNAIRLYDREGAEIKLSDNEDNPLLPLIKTNNNMKAIALKLGLSENATEDQIIARIGEVLASVLTLTTANTELTGKVKSFSEEKCSALVDQAITEKRITADKKDAFLKMAAADFENTKTVLLSLPVQAKPSDVIEQGKKADGKEPDEWKELTDKGSEAVEKLKAENPDQYKKLYRKNFGFDPTL